MNRGIIIEDHPLKLYYNLAWLMRGWVMSFVKCYDLRVGVELGAWRGGTTLFLLDYEPELKMHAVDIFEQQPDHPEYCGKQYDFTDSYPYLLEQAHRYEGRLVIHKGRSHEVVNRFENRSLDFVLIDADHSYESVKQDILDWRPKVCPGGFVMGHDIHKDGVREAVMEVCGNYTVNYGTFCWIQRIL